MSNDTLQTWHTFTVQFENLTDHQVIMAKEIFLRATYKVEKWFEIQSVSDDQGSSVHLDGGYI